METQTASSTRAPRSIASARAARAARSTASSGKSKTEQAHAIFTKLHASKSRKEVLEQFTSKVGLTASSASTYYQKFLTELTPGAKKRTSGTSGRGRHPDESSKAGICRALFKKLSNKPRKEVLAAFIDKAELTPAGASTYYQKLKHAA